MRSRETDEPTVIVDPECRPAVQKFIRRHTKSGLLWHVKPGEMVILPSVFSPFIAAARVALVGGVSGSLAWFLNTKRDAASARLKSSLNATILDHAGVFQAGFAQISMVLAVWVAGTAVVVGPVYIAGAVYGRRRFHAAQGHFVLRTDLDGASRKLLDRAHAAVQTVRATALHRDDLLDRQRNDVALPAQLWTLAQDLAEYSRLVDQLASTERSQIMGSLKRRVIQLEKYATQAREADALYAKWLRTQERADNRDAVLTLLARTAAEDWDIAETVSMTSKAQASAAALRESLQTARETAITALHPSHQSS
jgi:hypothetical protein